MDVPLQNPSYPGFFMGAYKTAMASWVAEHALIYRPSIETLGDAPLVRINSACFTGDIFGDRRCDCTEQMFSALDLIGESAGLLIYHFHHEGRGLGFTSKLETYKKMDAEGVSTFCAMREVSNRNDLRTYASSMVILEDLGITRLRLMTNNPLKKQVLEENGFEVVETVPIVSKRKELKSYLKSKCAEQGHLIDFGEESSGDAAEASLWKRMA
ncbi:MAG: GTP cyclohydrolase [Alphaproteobacteria bacterium]|nr:GTP cyclohydrolase [Alphaproteobacteria bacterium]